MTADTAKTNNAPRKSYDQNNIFARVLRGEIPCNKVYEDKYTLAFYDIAPQAPTHILAIPKGAYVDIEDFTNNASDAEIAGFMRAVGKIVREQGLEPDGFRLISNTGANGGQEVPHLHFHLVGGKKLGPMLPKA